MNIRFQPLLSKVSIVLAIMLTGLCSYGQPETPTEESLATTHKFNALYEYVDRYYVDSVDGEDLVEEAIRALLDKLDPHSIYIPKEELQEMNAPLKGNFEGIGIRFQILKDTIMVVNPIPGGPSEKIGIMAGDKIVKIEGENVAGVGVRNSDVREKLLGKKGTKVKVNIKRKSAKNLLSFTITRDKIPLYSLDASYMASPGIGYIKLNNFSATTMNEFGEAIAKLKSEGMESLILDLQGNGGGYLKTAIDLADEFLTNDQMIVYTRGRSVPTREAHASEKGGFEKGKLIVLINESSASASEIVSGAVQDWDRGLIIGRRSFGKGLVQRQIDLPDGSAMRLTISRYYTPSGRCIQKPYEDGTEAYHREKFERLRSGELVSKDSIHLPDSLKYNTLVTKREVYGGGGIMPDIFVPLDTTGTSEYYSQLIRKGHMSTFCLEYVDKNREDLKKKYPDFKTFRDNFKVEAVVSELVEYAKKKGLEFDQEGFDEASEVINIRTKATIAQNLWSYRKFYEIINVMNPAYMKAVEILEGSEYDNMNLAFTVNQN